MWPVCVREKCFQGEVELFASFIQESICVWLFSECVRSPGDRNNGLFIGKHVDHITQCLSRDKTPGKRVVLSVPPSMSCSLSSGHLITAYRCVSDNKNNVKRIEDFKHSVFVYTCTCI